MHTRLTPQQPAVIAAEELQRELGPFGITADVHEGRAIALLSVWVDLVVWVDDRLGYYRWWSGKTSAAGRYVWAFCAVGAPKVAARRIARRYNQLCKDHPLERLLTGPGADEGAAS